MSQIRTNPRPAMVTVEAAQSLPRWILFALCSIYVLSGFIGREPWREEELSSFGYMLAMANGQTSWFSPNLLGVALSHKGPLAYALGGLFVKLSDYGLNAFLAARIPFILLMAASLVSFWHALYQLAHHPLAQPISFAFGGEARPKDYARSVADAGLLALLACFGLLQFSHEVSPSILEFFLTCLCLLAFSMANAPHRTHTPLPALLLGLSFVLLAFAGAPVLALVYALAGVLFYFKSSQRQPVLLLLACIISIFTTLVYSSLQPSHIGAFKAFALQTTALLQIPSGGELQKKLKLLAWFVWPTGYVALWALWRWRSIVLRSSHLSIPLTFALTPLLLAFMMQNDARMLFLALPGLAMLAAFVMPTLSRSTGAFIDWFTMLFFSFGLLVFWVFWFSMHLGIPAKPAQNIQRLVVGFTPEFSILALCLGLAATVAWGFLVAWRTSRLRKPLWKSMALPAGGVTLFWIISMTLFLPVWDFARSQKPLATQVMQEIGGQSKACIYIDTLDIRASKIAALEYYTALELKAFPAIRDALPTVQTQMQDCHWLILSQSRATDLQRNQPSFMGDWRIKNKARIPTKRDDASQDILIYRRIN